MTDKDEEISKLRDKAEDLKHLYAEQLAYNKFLEYLEKYPRIKTIVSEMDIESIFPKPSTFEIDMEPETNENGDQYIGSEFTDSSNNPKITEFPFDKTWLKEKSERSKIYSNSFYQNVIRPNIGSMPEEVKAELKRQDMVAFVKNGPKWENCQYAYVNGASNDNRLPHIYNFSR